MSPSRRAGLVWLGILAVAAALADVLWAPRIQDPAYHRFADTRTILGVPNGLDVLSNLGFLAVGLMGLTQVKEKTWRVLFAGVALTAVGSSWYHLAPDDARLFWDRLPMTIVFTALLGIAVIERVDERAGRRLFWPLILGGIACAVLWRVTGDLRPYVFAQYYPVVALPVIYLLFPGPYEGEGRLVFVVAWYALAKVFEALDAPIFSLGHVVSGHTLKHVAAALATWEILAAVRSRQPRSTAEAGHPAP